MVYGSEEWNGMAGTRLLGLLSSTWKLGAGGCWFVEWLEAVPVLRSDRLGYHVCWLSVRLLRCWFRGAKQR